MKNRRKNRIANVASGAAVFFTVVLSLGGPFLAQGATYTFTQTDWSGGLDGGQTMIHPTNQTGWTKYSTSTGVNAAANSISLTTSSQSILQTSPADFNAGTFSNVTTTGSGMNANVTLTSSTSSPDRIDYGVGSTPQDATFDSYTNSVWVANYGSNSVSKINPVTGASTTYSGITNPYGITYDSYTKSVWVSSYSSSGGITKINVITGTSTFYSGVGYYSHGAAFDSYTNSIWVANNGTTTVTKVNVINGSTTTYGVGNAPQDVAFDPVTNSVWVTNYNSATVSQINPVTGTSTVYASVSRPYGIAFDSYTNSIWVAGNLSNLVSKINVLTGASTTYSLGGGVSPQETAFDANTNSVWVVNSSGVWKVNILTGTSTLYTAGASPTGAAFDPVTNSVWVTNYNAASVSKINNNPQLRTDFAVGTYPKFPAYDPITNSVWVPGYTVSTVSRVNVVTGSSTSYSTGGNPGSAVFDPVNNFLWVPYSSSPGGMSRFSLPALTATSSLTGFNAASGGVYDPVTNSIWVTSGAVTGAVFKINVVTGTSTTYATNNTSPYAIAFDPVTNSVWTAGSAIVTKTNIFTGATSTYSVSGASYWGIAFDSVTNSIWVSAGANIDKININTGTSTAYSLGSGASVTGLTFDPWSGSLYVADQNSNRVAKMNPGTGAILGYFYTGQTPYTPIVETSTDSLWVPNYSSSTISKISLITYAASGTFTSAALNAPSNQSWGNISWTNSGGQTIVMKARSANNASMTGAAAWSSCGSIANGGSLTAGGCVNNGDTYIQYQAVLSTSNLTQSPLLAAVTLAYVAVSTSGSLVSSAYDTTSTSNIMGSLSWNEGAAISGATATVSMRTASTSAGLAGTSWADFTNATANCSKVSGVVTCPFAALPANMQTSTGNEWFQYKVALATNGSTSPNPSSVSIQYVVNAPPQLSTSSPLSASEISTNPSNAGQVQINYSVLDSDENTDTGANGHATSTLTPTVYYSLNGGGSWTPAVNFVSPLGDIPLVSTSSYLATSTVWKARTDAGQVYNSSALVKVVVDDHQAANNLGNATTSLVLDTTVPTMNSLSMDASAQTVNFNFSDESALSYRISGTAFTSSTPTSTLPFISAGGISISTTSYALPLSSTSSPVVYVELQDAYGNDFYQTYAGPTIPTGFVAKDVSNKQIGAYQVYLSWATSSIANFKQYDIFRSTGGAFSQIATVSPATVSNYTDTNLSSSTAYYYKMRVEDTTGNISAFTPQMFITPTGNGGGPAISSVSVTPADTSAVVTWNTNIVPQASYVYWSTSPIMAQPVSIVAATASSGPPYVNTAQLTSLTPSTTYYFYVQSTDAQGNTTIDNNGGAYYSFTATNSQPPVISNIQVTPTQNSVDIRWNTNKAANSAAWYGTSSHNENTSVSSTLSMTTNPEVVINNLSASSTYYYYLQSIDGLGHTATTTESTFITLQLGPIISAVTSTNITTSSASISWATNKTANSFAYYSTSTNANSFVGIQINDSTTTHAVALTGLMPTSTYYYYVQSTDGYGNVSTDKNGGAYYSFRTAADTQPPVISNIQTPTVGQSVATVSWSTNKPASSQIFYGTSTGAYANSTVTDPTLLTAHSVSLTGLAAATRYYFMASSTDQYGNAATSSQQTFVTLTLPGPQISQVAVASTSDFGATVTWQTDTNSDSHVYYSNGTSSFAFSAGSSALVGGSSPYVHSVTLANLTPSTTYYFYVQSVDQSNNATVNNNGGLYYSLTTTNSSKPAITVLQVTSITTSTASVGWTTNKLANSQVLYGTVSGSYPSSTPVQDATTTVLSHAVALSGLTASTTYYYVARSADSAGNTATSGEQSFTTTIPAAPVISGVAATSTDFTMMVSWTTNTPADSTVFYGTATSSLINSVASTTLVVSHVLTLTNLSPGTTYYYYVRSVDAWNNATVDKNGGAYYSATTTKSQAPVITAVTTASTSPSTAVISWTTNVPTNASVYYATSTGAVASSTPATSSTLATAHAVTLTGLAASSTYYYSVKSVDQFGNTASDTNAGAYYSFVTTLPPFSITGVAASSSDTGAAVSWTTSVDADSFVFYATSTGAFSSSTGSQNLTGGSYPYIHSVSLTGLVPSSTYYYYVRSADASGRVVSDKNGGLYYSFTTTHNQAPLITNVHTTLITGDTAGIAWTTDKLADSAVMYGTSTGRYSLTLSTTTVGISREIFLTGLSPTTTYYYAVRSQDAFGNAASSSEYNFTTPVPVFSGVSTTYIGDTSAVVSWQTMMDGSSFVHYFVPTSGPSGSAGVGTTTFIGGTAPYQHAVSVTGLQPATTYLYYLETDDVNNIPHTDTNNSYYYTFTTTDHTPPAISTVAAPVVSQNSAIVTWTTNKMATSLVQLGTASGNYSTSTTFDPTLTSSHAVLAGGLAANTTYYYVVRSKSSVGVEAVSSEGKFTTPSGPGSINVSGGGGGFIIDTTPPQIIGVVATATPFTATVTFTTDKPTVGLVQYGLDNGYGYAASDSNLLTSHTIVLKGLVMGTTYHYSVKAIDKSGNTASTLDATLTTQYFTQAQLSSSSTFANAYQFQQEVENGIQSILPSLAPPFLEAPQVSNVTETGATVSWKTNLKSYSVVFYAPDASYFPKQDSPYSAQSSDISAKVIDHSVALTGLQPNTLYHMMAESFSIPGVFGKSGDVTFTTKASKVVGQVGSVTPTTFRVAWTTPVNTNSVLEYTDAKTGTVRRITDDAQRTFHDLEADNLVPGTPYTVRIFGFTEAGNEVDASSTLRITTTRDLTPPVIKGLKIETVTIPQKPDVAQAIVSWVTDKPADSVVYYDQGVGSPGQALGHTIADTASFATDHMVIVPNLTPGAVYRIQVASTDQAGNRSILPVRTTIIPQQSQSIFDVIFKNFEDTFKFLRGGQ